MMCCACLFGMSFMFIHTTRCWPTLSAVVGAHGPMVLSGAREADEDVLHRGLCVYMCTDDVLH